jgi:plastocyanin
MPMRKSMRLNNKFVMAFALTAGISLSAATTANAGGGKVDITPDREKACAKADKRYAKLYPDAPKDDAVIVKLYKYNFCPANLTVKAGTKVRWINVDKRTSHSVWLKEAKVDESERFFPEEMWEYRFENPGKYPYLCGPHWEAEGMLGFVKVTP